MTDVPALCRRLAVLRRALAAAGTPPRLDDPATPHPAVAATLTPTPPPAEGRSVPGSRVPIDLDRIALADNLDQALCGRTRPGGGPRSYGLAGDLRGALGHKTRDRTAEAALVALATHTGLLDDEHPLARRIPAVLESWVRLLARTLGVNEPVLVLGPCPEIHQDAVPVAWDSAGRAVAYVEVRECVAYDTLASTRATDARRRRWERDVRVWAGEAPPVAGQPGPVDVWRRSHIVIPRDGDILTATARCPGCGRRWPPSERARLAQLVERQAAEQLTSRERMPV